MVWIFALFRADTVPILRELLWELQQHLNDPTPVPTTGEVVDAASSERINVTLPRGVMDDLKKRALDQGRSCGNLASFLIEDGLRRHSMIN